VQRAHGGRERLLAGAALVEAGARTAALKLGRLAHNAAMGASRAIGPAQGFKVLAGGGFVGKNLVGKVASHRANSFVLGPKYKALFAVRQVHNSPCGEGEGQGW